MRALQGTPYDGHTLAEALEQVEILTGQKPSLAVVDRAYRVETTRVLISGTRKGITPALAKRLRRRGAIEPEIGHMKSDGRLARCPLPAERNDRRRDLRRPLRLRSQHPQDLRPPKGNSHRNVGHPD